MLDYWHIYASLGLSESMPHQAKLGEGLSDELLSHDPSVNVLKWTLFVDVSKSYIAFMFNSIGGHL